jgi:hypothetical protein
MVENEKIVKKTLLDLIEDACEILKNSVNLLEIVIKGKKTNIKITKKRVEDGSSI